jgi:eukaryotic-like serine/threonine-protein kinase
VLLFRLLSGVRPYDMKQPTRSQLERAILNDAPKRLSGFSGNRNTRPSSVNSSASDGTSPNATDADTDITPQRIAELRSTTPERLQRALSGDLDLILATALKKRPNERYATVQAFADDIQRHLNHQPILARADSWAYRAAKFARRNWIPVAAAAAVGVTTVGGVATTLWQAKQVKAEAQRANAIKDFLIGVFSSSDTRIANDKPRGQMTARELLDVSAGKIEKDFADYPETQHDLLGYFAEIYGGLSEDKRYDELREKQRLLIAKHYAPLSDKAIEWSLNRIDRICDGDLSAACVQLLKSTDEQIKQAGRDDSPLRAQWLRYQGLHLSKKPMLDAEVRAAYIGAIALFEKHEPRSMRLVDAITDLAVAYVDVLDFPKAIEQYQRALRVSTSVTAPEANRVAKLYSHLAHALSSVSRYEEAIEALLHHW